MRHSLAAAALLVLTACGGNDPVALDQSTPVPTPFATSRTLATAAPAPATSTPAATPSATRLPSAKPRATTSPTPSPTPVDRRPRATVVVINGLDVGVEGHIGDFFFHLGPGERTGRKTVHIDPGGNTSASVYLSELKSCGSGGPQGLLEGKDYTAKVYEGGSCPGGKPGPSLLVTP